ncbi:glycerol-3-phosphate 1-O-acyltransferase PlsY [Marivivens donghaensis]|uniref:Glycerol-3-phosphate acyltransferase n=1 Tax=Marivivens donghaensis TaxID=1699413 RepID=A0ABX0W259_9RHOB|nr:glycerol-3-phosphate 1-O-acyltransferase PlsY [Marivivens donghaensis]NIY73576.1 glycerol-3-phosphate 1-O-acyltransferase PlsY [Marivivens donghaensis]
MPTLTEAPLVLLLWAVVGYLLGSIPFGMILSKLMNLGDLRSIGSGNIGATNVLRTGNKKAAFATLILDGGKGAVAVLLARELAGDSAAQVAAFASFLGHCFPIYIGFKGGKGVATFIGIALAIAWPVGLLVCLTWLVVAVVTRYSSLSALAAATLAPFIAYFLGFGQMVLLFILLALVIYVRHKTNIERLLSGQESKIGNKG